MASGLLGSFQYFERTGTPALRTIDLLILSGSPALGLFLRDVFHRTPWSIAESRTLGAAIAFLCENRVGVLVCDDILPDGSWHDAAAEIATIAEKPEWIVIASRPAIAREVIDLGGFDVLVRPLRESEVVWTLASAWHSWKKRLENTAGVAPMLAGV